MDVSPRPLIHELLDWIDREVERAEKGTPAAESEPQAPEARHEPERRERLKVPSSIPA
jgi:hypothetical protein